MIDIFAILKKDNLSIANDDLFSWIIYRVQV